MVFPMKKAFVIFLIFLSFSFLHAGHSSNTMLVKEYIGFNSYNYVGRYSDGLNPYSVNSVSSNVVLENNIDLYIGNKIGVTVDGGVGYQRDIYCFNRFASIPSNINAKAEIGVVYAPIQGLHLSLSGGLRTSYLLNKSNWISQIGGELSMEYAFDFGLCLSLSSSYWYNTNYRSILCGVGLGYKFGGER